MKRHDALAPLSREHHDALILAQLLKKNAPPYRDLPHSTDGKAGYAKKMFKSILQEHFSKEEIMMDKVKDYHDEIKRLALEIVAEHEQLANAFSSLDNNTDIETSLDNLGRALEAHIRKEERILFPLIQLHCPPEILSTIEL